jgi:hypothetical protein
MRKYSGEQQGYHYVPAEKQPAAVQHHLESHLRT